MTTLTRRAFAASAMAALSAEEISAQKKKGPITAASVPSDPAAPEVSQGTQAEEFPFDGPIEFARADVPLRVQPFAMTEVRLLPSAYREAQETNLQYLRDLPADRLLHVFRLNAGLPSTAEPLGGWEKPDCELRGHFVGHYLSACALMYSATGDEEVKSRGDYLISELAKCQARLQSGYLSAFPLEYFDRLQARTRVWAPFYTIHKIMVGLLDMHEHCGNKQALEVVTGMADWSNGWIAALPEERLQMVLDTEFGGMGEVLYNLAVVTGDAKYARAGDRFTKKRFVNPLALRRDELRGLHVNTHIPQVIAAARRYEISGDWRFREVADYFWHTVTETRTYATGGTSNNEGWLVSPSRLAEELRQGYATNECCCAYNMLKLTRKLYQWTGDPRFFDYYERVLYNHRLGTIQPEGAMQYYLGVVPGSWRTFSTKYNSFWCCDGTGVEEFSKLNDSIYFHDENGIYVNLFIPSEVNWQQKGFRLRQRTGFPEEARSTFVIDSDPEQNVILHVRVPSWVAGIATLRINGQSTYAVGQPGSYLSIARAWKKGDRVEIDLPMQLRYEAMPDDPNLRAIAYGPLVFAGELGTQGINQAMTIGPEGPNLNKHPAGSIPSFQTRGKAPDGWLRAGDEPLTFQTTGQEKNVRLVPFCSLSGQRYSIYWMMS